MYTVLQKHGRGGGGGGGGGEGRGEEGLLLKSEIIFPLCITVNTDISSTYTFKWSYNNNCFLIIKTSSPRHTLAICYNRWSEAQV